MESCPYVGTFPIMVVRQNDAFNYVYEINSVIYVYKFQHTADKIVIKWNKVLCHSLTCHKRLKIVSL